VPVPDLGTADVDRADPGLDGSLRAVKKLLAEMMMDVATLRGMLEIRVHCEEG
jgi:hypothetical protein